MSRISKTVKNTKVALFFLALNLFLNFIIRSVFLEKAGADIVGLNAIATNLVGLLNIADLGIISAIASSLYKPLHDNDKKTISEIVSFQGWLYRKFAYFIIASSLILMMFFPFIFRNENVASYYPYLIFSVLLTGSLLVYFVTYAQVVLIANMEAYKINYIKYSGMASKVVLQILCLYYLDKPIFYWLALEFIFPIGIAFFTYKLIKKELPWLDINIDSGSNLKIKYADMLLKIKQLFFHKIAGAVQWQVIPIILYMYTSLSDAAKYDSYFMIITGLSLIFSSFWASLQPAVGNLIVQADKEKILRFFNQYISAIYFIAGLVFVILLYQMDKFISLWLGKDFVLDSFSLLIIIINFFLSLARTFDIFIYAYGIFDDVLGTVTEALVSIMLSLFLGYFWGMPGVLLGTTVGLFLVPCCWRGYFLFRKGFKCSPIIYFRTVFSALLPSLLSILTVVFIMNMGVISLTTISNHYLNWIFSVLYISFIYLVVAMIIFCLTNKYFREVMILFKSVIR